jgi:hypothetical protein
MRIDFDDFVVFTAVLSLLAGLVAFIIVFIVCRLLRWRHPLVQWIVFIGLGVGCFGLTFGGTTNVSASVRVMFSSITTDFCGGPTNYHPPCNDRPGASEWARFGDRYWRWLMTPPTLRPPCATVDPKVCDIEARYTETNPTTEYVVILLMSLTAALASMAAAHLLFNRWGRQPVIQTAAPPV